MSRLQVMTSILLALQFHSAVVYSEDRPSFVWEFEDDSKLPGDPFGQVVIAPDELQEPAYPGFLSDNRVLRLSAPSWIEIKDVPGSRDFDLENGDEVTFEAWVRLKSIGENMCLVSKGRTESEGARAFNQNWAFRLRNVGGSARLNFLFRSRPSKGHSGDWHRWTSDAGISSGGRWHHVALRYRFGDPESVSGVIDGQTVSGKWDMGGATTEPPIVDNDSVWIGSTMAGNKRNSIDGALDRIAIHRRLIPLPELRNRFRWVPPEVIPPAISEGRVSVQLYDSVASISDIPIETGPPVAEWQQDELAFVQLPNKYDSWGVREDWGSTVLVRAWANVELPAGRHQLLVRSRGRSRLKVDGQVVAQTNSQKPTGNAHNTVKELPAVPVPGMRPTAMGDTESLVSIESDGKPHLWLWEIIVGGPKYRLEFGETCVATDADSQTFRIVSGVSRFPVTDDGWLAFSGSHKRQMDSLDRANRTIENSELRDYWDRRHRNALDHVHSGQQRQSIDQLIAQRIAETNRSRSLRPPKAELPDPLESFFISKVQPVFESHCTRCHGDREQGGLLIVDRARLLAGGESGQPAVVPGRPEESYLLELVAAPVHDYRMPPKGDGLSAAEVDIVRQWIQDGARMPETHHPKIESSPVVDDETFLRRIYLDTVGVPPTISEAERFLNDRNSDKRSDLVRRLVIDDRWSDNWTGYWQDVLAENPNLLKPTLNNTGPFRYWIHEALLDNKPVDRFATELIMMRGSTWGGGAAGFSQASQNDAPMAARSLVVASGFLGINMKCARCHDAPYHRWKQSDLFQMAAMLGRKPTKLPQSSSVPPAFFEKQQRQSLIEVTLRPGAVVNPRFPFAHLTSRGSDRAVTDSRERLAIQVTSSRRFAEVIANRVWKRMMGAGVVEPADDWEGNPPSNPELLRRLADVLIEQHYDVRELAAEIADSNAYQRKAINRPPSGRRWFEGPYRRRMSAEQIVDSAFHVVGVPMNTEQLTMDVEGAQPASRFLNFGFPQRSWEFTTMANERDRPSLALPRAQAIADVLKAFGWRNSRPEPETEREETPNIIQPGVLANGTVSVWLTRLSPDNPLTELMISASSPGDIADQLFLRLLTRRPSPDERRQFEQLLAPGFKTRSIEAAAVPETLAPKRFRYVSWSNHLNTEANVIKMQMQELARRGPPPDPRLQPEWRERAEDAVWSLLNSPEMIIVP